MPSLAAGHSVLGEWQFLAELVHRVVRAARLQGGLAGEVFLVVVADVGAGHALTATPLPEKVSAEKPRRGGMWTFAFGFIVGVVALFGFALFAALRSF